ncbi:hypothetical protein YC2023_023487 [Brassica napus]
MLLYLTWKENSTPITTWNQERSSVVASTTIVASPLPVPPLVVPRSYSIPSRGMGQRHLPETNQNRVVSPPPLPLTPASLMNLRSLSRSRVGEVAHSGQIRVITDVPGSPIYNCCPAIQNCQLQSQRRHIQKNLIILELSNLTKKLTDCQEEARLKDLFLESFDPPPSSIHP